MADPFARPTIEDRARWLRLVASGVVPRICLVPLTHPSRRG